MIATIFTTLLIGSVSCYRMESSSRVTSTRRYETVNDFVPPPPAPKKVALPAKWLPIGGYKAPLILDGTLAGDVGFDPIGFAKSTKTLYWMREAEVKHGRLAMLAAVGWPLSELWHKELASLFRLDSILASSDRAPSLLNGGLSNVWVTGMLMMSIIIAGYLEGNAMNSGEVFWGADKPVGYVPGTLGFDPLNLYKVRGNKNIMETAEIKNGRLAMIAITAYVFQEFATGIPVVQQTPFLF
eukprot:CAMPEP_0170065184 /NCGR_PEP_ID=MMETSP0019_2-20121128/5365_1 /TAXON_ID=98059 /ORGANISM="Dinobryon sp., Strain UTEXLB2267" /LENGTH=240 /DNA_ID=CAMNT_0010271987 /DNA_START=31 /DNA_END=753 /DNA_ORIENTATION=+